MLCNIKKLRDFKIYLSINKHNKKAVMTLKSRIQSLLLTAKVHWKQLGFIVLVVLLSGIAVGSSLHSNNIAKKKKIQELHQLEIAQKAKADELKNKKSKQSETADTINLEFKDISEGAFQKQTCHGFEKMSGVIFYGGCQYRLRALGKLNMAVVLLYENDANTAELLSKDTNNRNSLGYTNTYLKNQARRYKVKDLPQIDMQFFGPYKITRSVIGKYYRTEGYDIMRTFSETSNANKVPEADYTMTHYVLLDNAYGGIATPDVHRAFTYHSPYAAVPTFIHETLHLLGASDKYNNSDCSRIGTNDPFGRYNGSLPGFDIMCSNFSTESSMINDITAREIGWAN